jgi:hypothetical protein
VGQRGALEQRTDAAGPAPTLRAVAQVAQTMSVDEFEPFRLFEGVAKLGGGGGGGEVEERPLDARNGNPVTLPPLGTRQLASAMHDDAFSPSRAVQDGHMDWPKQRFDEPPQCGSAHMAQDSPAVKCKYRGQPAGAVGHVA